jgi:hypothetical protein
LFRANPTQCRSGHSPQRLWWFCGSVYIGEEKRVSLVSTQPEALTAPLGTLQGFGSSSSAQAALRHEMFVNTLGTAAGSYAATDAANAIAAG